MSTGAYLVTSRSATRRFVLGLLLPVLLWSTTGCATMVGHALGNRADRRHAYRLTNPTIADLVPLQGHTVDVTTESRSYLFATIRAVLVDREALVIDVPRHFPSGVGDTLAVSDVLQVDGNSGQARTALTLVGLAADITMLVVAVHAIDLSMGGMGGQ